MDIDLQTYYKENQEQVEEMFANHIENLQYSGNSDAGRLSQSEEHFWEWLEDVVEELKKMEKQKTQTYRQNTLSK